MNERCIICLKPDIAVVITMKGAPIPFCADDLTHFVSRCFIDSMKSSDPDEDVAGLIAGRMVVAVMMGDLPDKEISPKVAAQWLVNVTKHVTQREKITPGITQEDKKVAMSLWELATNFAKTLHYERRTANATER